MLHVMDVIFKDELNTLRAEVTGWDADVLLREDTGRPGPSTTSAQSIVNAVIKVPVMLTAVL